MAATVNGASLHSADAHLAMIRGPNGITTKWESVTPSLAASYLQSNHEHNRRRMPALRVRYQRDIADGHWHPTHEGIAFDSEGRLVDGQHRLEAIAESGRSVWMLVTRNLPPQSLEVINRGRSRTLTHALQIMGMDANNRLVATARMMYAGPSSSSGSRTAPGNAVTDIMLREFIEQHVEAITFAMEVTPRTVAPASVVAVIARAYYHADQDNLRRFTRAMTDAVPDDDARPEDRTARALRSYLDRISANIGGSQARHMLYRKAQTCLRAYLDGRVLNKVYESADDVFPLPGHPAISSNTP